MTKHAKIAITIPPEDLAAADRLAIELDRSRSWIVAEAVRRYVAAEKAARSRSDASESRTRLDPSRAAQLARDVALSAEARVREAEDISVFSSAQPAAMEQPRRFETFDAFSSWRRSRDAR